MTGTGTGTSSPGKSDREHYSELAKCFLSNHCPPPYLDKILPCSFLHRQEDLIGILLYAVRACSWVADRLLRGHADTDTDTDTDAGVWWHGERQTQTFKEAREGKEHPIPAGPESCSMVGVEMAGWQRRERARFNAMISKRFDLVCSVWMDCQGLSFFLFRWLVACLIHSSSQFSGLTSAAPLSSTSSLLLAVQYPAIFWQQQ